MRPESGSVGGPGGGAWPRGVCACARGSREAGLRARAARALEGGVQGGRRPREGARCLWSQALPQAADVMLTAADPAAGPVGM